MKMGKIIEAVPALRKVSDLPLSLKTLYKVKNLMLKLEHEINFYNEERMKIIESLGDNGRSLAKTGQSLTVKWTN